MSVIGDRIKACRLINHLTLDDVARYLGIGKQAVHKYEVGTVTNIPLENVQLMAKLFHTTPAYLAGWTDIGAPSAPLDVNEQVLVNSYRSLLPRGKELLIERAGELTVLYGKKSQNEAYDPVQEEESK